MLTKDYHGNDDPAVLRANIATLEAHIREQDAELAEARAHLIHMIYEADSGYDEPSDCSGCQKARAFAHPAPKETP
jgi:hypothetical protein